MNEKLEKLRTANDYYHSAIESILCDPEIDTGVKASLATHAAEVFKYMIMVDDVATPLYIKEKEQTV